MALTTLALSPSQRASLETATAAYEANLEGARDFLVGRGVLQEAARTFRLGVVGEPMPGHEGFRGWLSIPYITPSGVVAMKFRRMDGGDGPKMLPPEGQKTRLYNTRDLFRREDTVVLCEGELDTIVAAGMLGVPAVGVPGAGQMKPHWPRCLADFERVIVCFDNDLKTRENQKTGELEPWNPGQNGAAKWVEALPTQAKAVPPPMGMDLNDWYLAEGRDAVLKGLGI